MPVPAMMAVTLLAANMNVDQLALVAAAVMMVTLAGEFNETCAGLALGAGARE